MKHLKRLVALFSIIIITTPQIIQMYKIVYDKWLKKQEEIEKKTKEMLEADKVIKTKFFEIKTKEDMGKKAEKLHLYQRTKLKLRELQKNELKEII